jgi:DNA-directed RNA polymerase subunit RPC12/RpoP
MKKCSICNKEVEEDYGKLNGTMLKIKNDNKNSLIYVCSECQKQENYIEKAKVRAA